MKRSTKMNLIFTLVVLAAAAALFLLMGRRSQGSTAVVTYNGGAQTLRIPLDQEGDFDLESGGYTIHLEVRENRIRFVNSPCPDHLCEGYGWLAEEGDFAACMPALASVVVQGPQK